MTCQHCQDNNGVFDMACLGCCARHVFMQFIPEGKSRIEYAKGVAKKHNHDFEQLKQRVNQIRKGGGHETSGG